LPSGFRGERLRFTTNDTREREQCLDEVPMSRRLRSLASPLLCFVLVAPACGGSTASATHANEHQTSAGGPSTIASASPSEAHATPLAIFPLRLRLSAPDAGEHFAELHTDGTIAVDGRPIGRIDGTRVLDAQGEVALELSSDGHISAPGQGPGPELTDDGALVAPDSRIVVTADGTIEERMARGRIRIAPYRFESLPEGSLRTAVVFVSYVAIASDEPAAPPTTSAVDLASSAAPSASPDAGASSLDAGRASGRRHH
jgi:hypothetical protein